MLHLSALIDICKGYYLVPTYPLMIRKERQKVLFDL